MNIWKRVCCVVASALIGALVFAPIGVWWLSVVAWVPLLSAVRGVSVIVATRLSVLHGVIFYGITMSWVASVFEATPWMVFPLVMVMSFFTGIFAAGVSYCFKKISEAGSCALFTASWWVAIEFVRSEIFVLKFPWMTPGVGVGPSFLSSLVGVYGISFLIILFGQLFLSSSQAKWWGSVGLLSLLLATLVQSTRTSVIEDEVTALAVQAEVVSHQRLLKLAGSREEGVDVIVFPEYAYGYDVRESGSEFEDLQQLSNKFDATVVLGTKTNHEDGSWQNTALSLHGRDILGVHYKNHTVHFFDDGVAGTGAKAIETPKGKIGTPICFDNDYEDVVRRMTSDGAEYFLVPSMDAKHWTDREHWQHAELFRHRAAENARWMVVASSSGVTQVIDPYGNRVRHLETMVQGSLVATIGREKKLTFYNRIGWLFPWCCMAASVFMIVIFSIKKCYSEE